MNITETSNGILEALSRCKNLLIVIKGSPDPDVIASSYALKLLAAHRGVRSQIFALSRISLPQNSAIVNELGISITFDEQGPAPEGYDAYAVLDHQSAAVERLTGRIPCAIHIDHHERTEDTVSAGYTLISTSAGSVSTIMALVIKTADMGLSPSERRSVSTALYLGMLTDTDNFRHAGPLEEEAVEFLSPMMDKKVISRITSVPLSEQTRQIIGRAIAGKVAYRDWLFAGLGYIDESIRDSIAIAADFLLERESAETVIIYAAIDRRHGLTLDASFRTRNPNLDLDMIIKKITPNGGGRMYKGAFQIDLDYFRMCDDRDAFWRLLDSTTRQVLKNSRDGMHFTELKGFYKRMKRTLKTLFTGEDGD
jgi:nanoRNase/pAp phosphatase (c-di-AMP/oligoRNAs hydrolase)